MHLPAVFYLTWKEQSLPSDPTFPLQNIPSCKCLKRQAMRRTELCSAPVNCVHCLFKCNSALQHFCDTWKHLHSLHTFLLEMSKPLLQACVDNPSRESYTVQCILINLLRYHHLHGSWMSNLHLDKQTYSTDG